MCCANCSSTLSTLISFSLWMCNIANDERRWSVIVFRSGVFNLLLFNAGVLERYGTVRVVRGMVTEGGIGAY